MKTMNTKVLLLAFLVLAGMIVSPVLGYTMTCTPADGSHVKGGDVISCIMDAGMTQYASVCFCANGDRCDNRQVWMSYSPFDYYVPVKNQTVDKINMDGFGVPYSYWWDTGSNVVAPTASFSCVPTSQYLDTSVVCTDTSTNTTTDWYWTVDFESVGVDSWQTSTSRNFTWQSHYPGTFSVNLKANNSAGYDWENKTNYVSVSVNTTSSTCEGEPATGYSRTKFRCMNPANDASIYGCNIQLQDKETGIWSNKSNLADAIWCIDTLPLHHIDAFADATGYTSGIRSGVQEWDNMQYTIPLIPGYVPNPSAGKVWVYVYVTDWQSQLPLSGATVSISGSGQSTQTGITGSSGGTSLQWANQTLAYINVAKSGYTTGSTSITTTPAGPDIVYISIHPGIYTATLTPVGTGTIPVTVGPYGTPGPLGTMPAGYTNSQGQIMMDFLARNGLSLVELCFFVTVLALLGVKLGK
jgi:PKD repeat protein